MYWGFKKIPFTLHTYVLAKILQTMLQSLYRNWLLVSKITWRVWATSLSKKYIPSAKTLNTEDLSSITFSYLCEHSPNGLFHFWHHSSVIFNILPAKVAHQSELKLKFTWLLMSFFRQKASFSLKFESFFSVMTDISSVLFYQKTL